MGVARLSLRAGGRFMARRSRLTDGSVKWREGQAAWPSLPPSITGVRPFLPRRGPSPQADRSLRRMLLAALLSNGPSSSSGLRRNHYSVPSHSSGHRRNHNSMPSSSSGHRRNHNSMPSSSSGLRRNRNSMPSQSSGLRRNRNSMPSQSSGPRRNHSGRRPKKKGSGEPLGVVAVQRTGGASAPPLLFARE